MSCFIFRGVQAISTLERPDPQPEARNSATKGACPPLAPHQPGLGHHVTRYALSPLMLPPDFIRVTMRTV